jgi:hypothetical protein
MECSAVVNGSSIVFISGDHDSCATNDLMHSILFAQLVANKRLVITPEKNWLAEYVNVLDDFWVRSVREKQEIQLEKSGSSTPYEWAVKALANGGNVDARVISQALDWVVRLPCHSPEMDRLRSNVQQASECNLAVSPVRATATRLLLILAESPASMMCLCLEFKTRQALEGNPWAQRLSVEKMEGVVSARYFRATLSSTLYALYRDAIAQKVRDKISGNVVSITKPVGISPLCFIQRSEHE